MHAIRIALKDLQVSARDRTGLIMLLAMPLILIGVLGAIFGNAFDATPTIEQFPVLLVDEDGGALAQPLAEIMQGEELSSLVRPVERDLAEAQRLVSEGQVAGAIVIPAGFTSAVLQGRPAELTVLRDPGRQLQPVIIEAIANGYADYLAASQIAIRTALEAGLPLVDLGNLGAGIAQQIDQGRAQLITEDVVPGVRISALQYYAIGMGCMFLLLSGSMGLGSIVAEERNETYARILSAPVSRIQFLLGKAGGQVALALAQFLILYGGTTLIYRVSWGSPPAVMLVALAYSCAVSGLVMLVSSLVKGTTAALNAWIIGVQIFAALGGSMVPLSQFSPLMLKLALLSPNYWGMNSFLPVARRQALPLGQIMPMFIIGFAGIAVAVWRLTKRQGVHQ